MTRPDSSDDEIKRLYAAIDALDDDAFQRDKLLFAPTPLKIYASSGPAPRRQTSGAAGYDLYVADTVTLAPWQPRLVPTGAHVAIPEGWVGKIHDRSSLHKLSLLSLAGVIDSDYRGEIKICLLYFGTADSLTLRPGERLCQLIVTPCLVDEVYVDTLEELGYTDRGHQGFGSTG